MSVERQPNFPATVTTTTTAPATDESGVVVRGAGTFDPGGGVIPGLLESQIQESYDLQALVIYEGYAALGATQAQAAWTIARYTLDTDGNPTRLQWSAANQIWNNRATTVTYS